MSDKPPRPEIAPPLIIEDRHIDRIFGTLAEAIRAVPA